LPQKKPQEDLSLDDAIDRIADNLSVPRELWRAMTNQESGGKTSAQSPKGAHGMFQIMPATAAGIKKPNGQVIDINDPLDNAYGGLKLLSDNYKQFRPLAQNDRHAWAMAIAGYHGNPKNVIRDVKRGGIGIPDQDDGAINTQDHVYKIMHNVPGIGRLGPDASTTPPLVQSGQAPKAGALPATPIDYSGRIPKVAVPVNQPPSPTDAVSALATKFAQQAPENARRRRMQQRVQQARASIGTNDAAWHFGMTPDEAKRLSPQAQQVLVQAVTEDRRKKAAGQEIAPPSLTYQNEMRAKAGLKPLAFNVATAPNATAPYYRPESANLNLDMEDRSGFAVPRQTPAGNVVERRNQAFNRPLAEQVGAAATSAPVLSDETKTRNLIQETAPPGFEYLPKGLQDWIGGAVAKNAVGLAKQVGALGHDVAVISPATQIAAAIASKATDRDLPKELLNTADELSRGAAIADAKAGRSTLSQGAQDVLGSTVSSAPALALSALGVPAPIAFGLQSYLDAQGNRAGLMETMKATGEGALIGELFELPLPAKLQVLSRIGARLGKTGEIAGRAAERAIPVGAGTAAITGSPQAAAVNALFAASGAIGKGEHATTETPEVLGSVPKPATEPPRVPERPADVGTSAPQLSEAVQAKPRPKLPVTEPDWTDVPPEDRTKIQQQLVDEMGAPTHDEGQPKLPITEQPIPPTQPPTRPDTPPKVSPETPAEPPTAVKSAEPPPAEVATTSPKGATTASTSSARKAQFAEDRAALDLPELPVAERKSWQRSLAEAQPEHANAFADEVLNKPRALTDSETASIVVRAQQIKNRHADVMKEIGDSNDTQSIIGKRAEVDALESEFDKLTTAAKKSGTEKGRALAAQKLTINQDYDLVSVVQRAKAAKGRELTTDERAQFEEQTNRIKELETKLTEAESQAKTRAIQKDIDNVIKRSKGVRAEKKQSLDDEFAFLKTELAQAKMETRGVQASGLAGLDPEGKLTPIILKMARNRAKAGILKAEEIIDQIHAAIKEHLDVSKDDIRDVLAGFDLRHDPLPAIKTRLKNREAALTEQLKTGEFPRREVRRRTPYDREASDLKARVDSLKRQVDAKVRGRDRIERTILNLRNAGLLTGLRTHARNIGGTATFQGFEEAARIPGAITDLVTSHFTKQRALGAPDPVAVAKSSYEAATKGVREAVQIVRHGASATDLEKIDVHHESNSGSKVLDTYINTVFRTLGAEDKVFRTYAYRRSIEEQAKLRSKAEGRPTKDLSANPTADMVSQAILDAEVSTFNNQNIVAKGLESLKTHAGPAGEAVIDLIIPFKRTPANIAARLLESTPLGVPKAAYDLAKAYRQSVNKKISFEAQRKFSQTIGRSVTGSGLITLGYMLAKAGLATGLYSEDKGERNVQEAAGRSPMSVRVGDTWHQIGAFSPLGNLIAVGAAMYKPDAEEALATRLPGIVGKVLLDQPFLRGPSQVVDVVEDPNRAGAAFFGGMAGSFVPTLASDVGALRDNTRRESKGVLQRVQSRVPIWRESLPERRDVFGDQLESRRSAIADPTLTTTAKDQPFLQEILRLDISIPDSPKLKDQKTGKPLETDDQYRNRLIKQGQEMKQVLIKTVESPVYQKKSDDQKKEHLKDVIEFARRKINVQEKIKYRQAKSQGRAGSNRQESSASAP